MQIIERIVTRVGRRVDESSPMVDARLADGSRVKRDYPTIGAGWASSFDSAIWRGAFDDQRSGSIQLGAGGNRLKWQRPVLSHD